MDEQNRALLEVPIQAARNSEWKNIQTWIDTAFDGHLVLPSSLIRELQLESLAEAEAILADGCRVTLETFLCYIDWFGEVRPLQVIANEGKLPLLGTGLLANLLLEIDYRQKEVLLD